MTAATIGDILREASEYAPEPPRPLRRELPPPEPFPLAALGSLAPATRAIHDRVQAPAAICANSVLATAALAVQAHADVVLPFGQRRPLSLNLVTVAESGDRKTSADGEALTPIRAFEEALRDEHAADFRQYENRRQVWEAERRRIIADKDLSREAKEHALRELGVAPEPPLTPMLTCPEPTFEGLTRLFAAGRPALGLFSDEGGQFVGGFGMSTEQRLKTAAGLSKLWDGEPLRRVRAGDGSSVLPGRRLAVHLLVQPTVASELLGDRKLAGQGLLSRFLPQAPPSAAGTRLWREPSPASAADLARYTRRIRAILDAPLPLREGTENELAPRGLSLTPRARQLWTGFHDHIEQQIGHGGALETVRAFSAKAAEHAARIAGVLTLCDDLHAPHVDEDALTAAIELTQHYLSEWLRLHDAAAVSPELVRAEELLRWLHTGWTGDVIGLPEIYQRGPNCLRDAKTARQAIGVLEEHGWVIAIEGGALVEGITRREAWRIVQEPGT